MGRKYEIISADGHLEVPADVWNRRVPAKFRDKTPRLVRHPDRDTWQMLDFVMELRGPLCCDLDYDKFMPHTGRTYYQPDGSPRPGTGNASQRLREQDKDGIDAEVLYPPVFGGGFLGQLAPIDRDAYLAIIRAYNDFLAEDYCAVAPDRLIGNAMVPLTGVEDAIKEVEHCRKNGLISASLTMWPNGGPHYKPEDERFFQACVDIGMKNSPHGGLGGSLPAGGPAAGIAAIGQAPGSGPSVLSELMLNGVFDRNPELQFYFAETNAGWLPHYMTWADQSYERGRRYYNVQLKKMPSEYIREHSRWSFIVDRLAMQFRYDIGLDVLMWGSDFPHSVGTHPHSREFLDDLFEGVPASERRQVLVDNVVDFFDLDPDRDLTPTPA